MLDFVFIRRSGTDEACGRYPAWRG